MMEIKLKDIKPYEEDGHFLFDLTYRVYKNDGSVYDCIYRRVPNPFSEVSLPQLECTDEEDLKRSSLFVRETKNYFVFTTANVSTDAADCYATERGYF